MTKTGIGVVLVFMLTASVAAQQNVQAIQNFLRVNTEICTGGQPTMEQLTALKAEGVTTVINLRTPQEYDAAVEEAKAKELGLRYFNIPVVSSGPKDEQAAEFLKLTDDPKNRPAFIGRWTPPRERRKKSGCARRSWWTLRRSTSRKTGKSRRLRR